MNVGIRRVGIGITVLFVALIANLTYLQVVDAGHLASDPNNLRPALRDFTNPRGEILSREGEVIARTVRVADGTDFRYQREYPLGALTSQVAGVQSFLVGTTGVERSYNDVLAGRDPDLRLRSIANVFSGAQSVGNVRLTLSTELQRAAAVLLGGQHGSVVVLDVRTGGVLAMYSNPTVDLSALAGHDTAAVQAAFDALVNDPAKPDLARAYRERYPPGSTFKVVTTAAGLEAGVTTPDKDYPVLSELVLPQTTARLRNFGGQSCGGTLLESFVESCNTTFGQLGLDLADRLATAMGRFGLGSAPPLDLDPGPATSVGLPAGSFADNQPRFALAGIGQGDVAVTPLEMALVAAAVANGGVMMRPHVLADVTDGNGDVVRSFRNEPWLTAMSPQTAGVLTQLMRLVVERGTGTRAQIPGVAVAGKTGTAQTGDGQAPHAWFIGFAPADAPRYAVAVLVEHGGSFGSEATGGAVAAPIAAGMLKAALALG